MGNLEVKNKYFTINDSPGNDALTLFGSFALSDYCVNIPRYDSVLVEDSIIDFRNLDPKKQDEAISGVGGARVTIRRCVIVGSIKAILVGNGDMPEADKNGYFDISDCIFMNCGRRCPEAQDGTKVNMTRVWVHNWGNPFDVRSFGAWAHKGSKIVATDCIFTQSKFFNLGFKNFFIDLANHIGQSFNEKDFRLASYILPGVCRGIMKGKDGSVEVSHSYKNHWWIKLDNHESPMDRKWARNIVKSFDEFLPKVKDLKYNSYLEMFDSES